VRSLAALQRSVRGPVLTPASPGFDDARQLFNAGAERVPAVIIQCSGDADVQHALRFAREEGLPVSVRAGGHSIGGHSIAADGVVIDLRQLHQISFEARSLTLTVGGGCLWSDVLRRLGSDFATPGAFDPRVGVAGLTLGGGYGMLSRLHGLSADNLVDADVLLADGSRALASEDPELLWAVRGAGANFGITTSLRLRLHPLRPLTVATVCYPLARVRELLVFYRELVDQLPDEATVYLGIGDQVELHGFCFGAQAAQTLAQLCQPGGATLERITPVGYAQAHAPNHATFPEGHHHHWRSHFFSELSLKVLEQLAAPAAGWRVLEHLGGAIGHVASDATAFPHRAAKFGFVSALKWPKDAAPPEEALLAQKALHEALQPHSLGSYVNYLHGSDPEAAYGANLPRLQQAKLRFDPDNVFRHNVNIPPAPR
jgi:FAD/FMN-containing dehydrogenase